MNECDCGARTEGKWAGIHGTSCPAALVPAKEGFFWGKWRIKAPGTADEDEPPGDEWEVMHVVINTLDKDDPEHLMVMVPGVQKWQAVEDFFWGEEVTRPANRSR